MANNEPKKVAVSFAAIDPYIQQNIPSPKEVKMTGREYVSWGEDNLYPYYLLGLYNSVPTLRSIINGNVDFITGDDLAIVPFGTMTNNNVAKGEDIREQVRNISRDFEIYGGFALQVIRNYAGEVAEICYIDLRYLRTDEDCNVFRYSEKWDKGGRRDVAIYPAFTPFTPEKWAGLSEEERDRHASSIVYVKNEHTQTYPAPIYAASIKDCEIEKNITDYHLNSLENGFMSSILVNFNNGVPSDADQNEITRNLDEKYSGYQNAARIMACFNRDKEHATTIEPVKVEDFGERYKALAEHSRQHIFTAFRANPNLFGIPTEGNGFANEQYEESFTLYNRTQIQPVRKLITETYERILGVEDALTITPFSLGDNGDTAVSLATQLGVGGTQSLMAVLESTTLTTEQKLGTLQVLFGLDDEAAHLILNLPYTPAIEENR